MKVYTYLCVLCVVYLTNRGANPRSVAGYDEFYVIASVGSRKELSCTKQTSISSNHVSWYRQTNRDYHRCPNQHYVIDRNTVFCDRLTNNRNVQPGFRQRFSVLPPKTENVNGLIITRVELSDAGIYACVINNNSRILARINFTAEEETTVRETMLETTKHNTSEETEHATARETLTVTTVILPTEFGTTTIVVISVACLLVGFIAGLFVATAIFKHRPGIIASDRDAATKGQGAISPVDGSRNRPATVDNYCELSTLDINPLSVYAELLPVDNSTSLPVQGNTRPTSIMEVPLYDDVVHSEALPSCVSTSAAYEKISISQ